MAAGYYAKNHIWGFAGLGWSFQTKFLDEGIHLPVLEQLHHLHVLLVRRDDVLDRGGHHQQRAVLLNRRGESDLKDDEHKQRGEILVPLLIHFHLHVGREIRGVWIEEESGLEEREFGGGNLQPTQRDHDLVHLPSVDQPTTRQFNLGLGVPENKGAAQVDDLVGAVIGGVVYPIEDVEGEGEVAKQRELIVRVDLAVQVEGLDPFNTDAHLFDVPHPHVLHRRRVQLLELGADIKLHFIRLVE
ncbi:hypothetical protein PENTCL1PPCAC_28970 [Pristionchus entomophagus]|uniref:Ribosomal protein n=1 Tax=Pristionchus entomophagus TaxID=358040 RepID=A0AAV5UIF4_9BILA|nr:hypothetical protein PENTCL1PPCAC_28970 [Pristionchus entomophagus]